MATLKREQVPASLLLASALAAAYLIWAPHSGQDLAAQTYRADLFADQGFVVFSTDWYAGFHVPGYSLLFPPLAALLGPRLAGALAAVAAAGLFALLARDHFGERAWVGSLWFAAATATSLFTGRLTFALGVAIGLGALLVLSRRRVAAAVALSVATSLASPVAGLFLAIAGVATALTGDRRGGAAVAVAALLAIGALTLAFPTGGIEPFVASAFAWLPIFALVALALLPREEGTLRWGVALYGLAAIAAFAVDNPVGGNITRLAALFGGPILALALWRRRALALALIAVPLVAWQWWPAVRDLSDAAGDPSTEPAFYAPLVTALQRSAGDRPVRVETLPTHNRWEAVHVAERFPLARGWLRQAESDDFDLFTEGRLTPGAYRAWLDRRGVAYVAVPDADLDYLADDEAALIEDGLPYLRRVWRNSDWTLYAVRHPAGLAEDGARVTELGVDSFRLDAPRVGTYRVAVRYSRYMRVTEGAGCVEPRGDWTAVTARSPGAIRVEMPFSLSAMLGGGSACSERSPGA